ncbi:MAG: hypothetical protein H0V72_18235 [Bradyrhizobium sp.]|nr:hypothetical protein [Bradyrhizobium sp.]
MTACIHPFPLHRNIVLVQQLSNEMSACNAIDVRDFMIERLGFYWDRLEGLGIDCHEVEYTIHALARELWAQVGRDANNSPGAA